MKISIQVFCMDKYFLLGKYLRAEWLDHLGDASLYKKLPKVSGCTILHSLLLLCCSVTKSCLTFCDLINCSMPDFSALHYLWNLLILSIESVMLFNNLILCWPLLLLSSVFPSIGIFQWVGSSHQMAKVLELQFQQQFFQWIFRVEFL